MREERKDQHIEYALKSEYQADSLLDDVYLEPQSFPELALDQVDLTSQLLGKTLQAPLMINAMTGGTQKTGEINRALGRMAKRFGLALQVGSQQVALDHPDLAASFAMAREELGEDLPLVGNLSVGASLADCQTAMAMIGADGIGLHVNASQELVMAEGDRDFRGWKDNLMALSQALPGRVIVKQIGFGMSREDCDFLAQVPVTYVDLSGAGGSNFIEIEDLRSGQPDYEEFYAWGVPTAQSLLNAKRLAPDQKIIASGGIKQASDLIRAMALGADYGALSGELLRYLMIGGEDYACLYLENFLDHFRMGMALLGCKRPADLKRLPYKLTGKLKELQ